MKQMSLLAVASALWFCAFPARAEKVGNVGAVNAAAHGAPPGAAKHPLSVGLDVQKNERIETAAEGTAQIIFNDTSTLSIGRNSSVVIDDFVFDGARGAQGVSIAKGALRFVGGGVSHGAGATLTTPTASIGLRGGSVLIGVGGDCGTLVVHQNGVAQIVGADGSSQILNRPGFGVCARASGVSEPFRVPAETIAALNAQMASRGAQAGGAKRKPTNDEANLMLGHDRPASVEPPPGLDALGPFWAGNALVQSRVNVENQPAPPLAPSEVPVERPRQEEFLTGNGQ